MKPLNLDNSPCSPVSSNCVIWQGPNIDCIDLCTGDSISTVVYKLATELCTIMNQLDLSNLDLTCLKVGTNPPDTFSELIQLLINKICNAGTGSTGPAAITDPCPTNCIVPIADCFKSGTQTTMLLLDYVQMIGEKVCSLVDQIDTINNNITNIDKRVTILENKPDPEPYVLPSILVDCTLDDANVIASNSYKLDVVLQALVNDDNHGYCALLSSLGQPGNVTSAYQFQSTTVGNYIGTTGASPSLANCGTPLQTEYTSWTATPLNLSDSFKNLWIAVSDIRRAHKTYEVVAGNTSVNVATATTATACGNKDTVTVSANLPIVAAGDNITVTPTTVSNVTTYTVAGKETIVAAGDNVTVTSAAGPGAGDTTYTVNAKEAIVNASSTEFNTTIVTPTAGPGAGDITYSVYNRYGLDMFACQWRISSDFGGSWMTLPSQLASAGTYFSFPASNVTVIKPNSITTTSAVDGKTYSINKTATNWFVPQSQFDTYGCTFGTFNVLTGYFKFNTPGTYLVTAHAHLRASSDGETIWTNNPGSFGIGLCSNATDLYIGHTHTVVPGVTRQIDLSCSKLVFVGTSNPDIFLNTLNYSDRAYNGNGYAGSDNIGFSIVRIKDGYNSITGI
jgi:hypothetical protein